MFLFIKLGSGTCLAGIVAAKIGAKITLSESHIIYYDVNLMKENILANNIELNTKSNEPGTVSTTPLTWGIFDMYITKLEPFDYIISSDCFYDMDDFNDILSTIAYFMRLNPSAVFYSIYHVRNSDWNIDCCLAKWNLACEQTECNQYSHLFELEKYSFLLIKLD